MAEHLRGDQAEPLRLAALISGSGRLVQTIADTIAAEQLNARIVTVILSGFPHVTVLPGLIENVFSRPATEVSQLFVSSAVGALSSSIAVARFKVSSISELSMLIDLYTLKCPKASNA